MPAPPSYIDITTTPFSTTVTSTDFNAGTFGGVADQTWFRFITASDVVFGTYIAKAGTAVPGATLYESDGSTVIVTVDSSSDHSWWQVLSAGTYYLKLFKHGGGAIASDFACQFESRPYGGFTVPVNAIVVNDDQGAYPASVMQMDGTLVGWINIPAGEVAAILPTGQSVWHDKFGRRGTTGSLALFDTSFAYVTSTSSPLIFDGLTPPLLTPSATTFYVVDRTTGDVYTLTTAGVATRIATIPSTTATGAGVSPDGGILYWTDAHLGVSALNDPAIHRFDLVNGVALTDLYTVTALETHDGGLAITPNNWPGDIIVLPDTSIVTWYWDTTAAQDLLLHLSADGTLLESCTYAHSSRAIDHLARAVGNASTAVNVWFYAPDTDFGHFATLTLATGVESTSFETALFEGAINKKADNATPLGPSTSCTMLTNLQTSESLTGTLTVTKDAGTDSTTSFPFTATGGLSPSSFSLTGGSSRVFTSVPVGTYGISETPPAGWLPPAYAVSTGQAASAITVAANASVTVTVTNTPTPTTAQVRATRRLRRFPLPFEANVYQFLSRLEVLVQSGVGLATGQGSDPVIMCRISRDGGETWGYELTMGLGKQGQYSYRAYLNRLGRGRNFVVELTTSDPVFVAILAAYADLETGTA